MFEVGDSQSLLYSHIRWKLEGGDLKIIKGQVNVANGSYVRQSTGLSCFEFHNILSVPQAVRTLLSDLDTFLSARQFSDHCDPIALISKHVSLSIVSSGSS